mmetsp:Transcript_7055/g.16072  ORF Transcript_7055/g.16072 Transcript_7055/m.16072 type:complete len:332 (-) Transcript_7055:270-1265(-)
MVCFSQVPTCSSEAYRLSETFILACINGSLTTASFRPCAVPGLEEDVLGREPPATGTAALEAVRAKVFPSSVSPASMAGMAGCGGGTGRSSKYSSASSATKTCDNSCCGNSATGLPCRANSRNETSCFRLSNCSERSSWLRDKSRISNDCQLSATLAGMSAMQFPARLSSASWGKQGKPSNACAVMRLPETSSVAKHGNNCGDPGLLTRKDKLANWFPSKRNSSSLVNPLTCSGAISWIWLWLADRTSRLPSPATPSSTVRRFRLTCNSLSFANLTSPRPNRWSRLLSMFKYSKHLRASRPSTTVMQLSSKWREAKLTQGSKPEILEIWQP